MSIRCGSCKSYHDTVQQVLDYSARKAGQSTCKHDLAAGTCITCARWNKRRGTVSIQAKDRNVPLWLMRLNAKATGTCSLCSDFIEAGDRITVRKGFKSWSHQECFADPGTALHQPHQKSQREPDPVFNDAYDKIASLEKLADELLPQAIQVEEQTDILCLKQIAQDMDYELSIDLIRETIYGFSLDLLGSWEPKEQEDYLFLEDEELALHQLQQAYAAL